MRSLDALAPLVPLLVATTGCTSMCCEPERLPLGGRAESPRALFDLVKHAGRYDCGDVLHGLMSAKTREKFPAWKFRSAWDSERFIVYPFPPPADPADAPYVYTLAEVIRGLEGEVEDEACGPPPEDDFRYGALFDTDWDVADQPRRIHITYERPHAPGARRATNVRFKLLVVPEQVEGGRTEWRLGLLEQLQDGAGGSPLGEVMEFSDPKRSR